MQVQSLEEDLRAERERCHKLSVSLSSCRRSNQKYKDKLNKCLPLNDHPSHHNNNNDDNYCNYLAMCECMIEANNATVSNSKEALLKNKHPNYCNHNRYMGIKPALMNPRSLFSRKVKPNYTATHRISTNHSTNHASSGALSNCRNDHSNVELLAHRLMQLIGDDSQVLNYNCGLKPSDSAMNCVDCSQSTANHMIIASPKQGNSTPICPLRKFTQCKKQIKVEPEGQISTTRADTNVRSTKSEDTIMQRDDDVIIKSNRELKTDRGNRTDSDNDSDHSNNDEELTKPGNNYINFEALTAENEALRKALLSRKLIEIKELEQQVHEQRAFVNHSPHDADQEIKQLNTEANCMHHPGTICINKLSDDKKLVNWSTTSDPVKYFDMMKGIEEDILEKRISGLALEGQLVTQLSSLIASSDANYDANHLSNYHEDLRHLLNALARDVVLLRKENEWLKTRFQG